MTVPEYYRKFIDPKVNLEETPKVCCPFHEENTPSFSYDERSGRWRCFGRCKTGGDTIDMHMRNFRLKSRVEAEESLCSLLGIPYKKISSIEQLKQEIIIDEESVELDRVYNLCLLYSNDLDRWMEVVQAMTFYPVDIDRLKDLLNKWGVKYD